MSPFERFEDWFQSLIPEHRKDIAFLLVINLPGFDAEEAFYLENLADSFLSSFADLIEDGKSIGVMLSIRSAIDFYFSDRRDNKEYWEAFRQDALYEAQSSGDEKLRLEADSALIRYRQWVNTLSKWYQLKEQYLNDEALHDWQASERYA